MMNFESTATILTCMVGITVSILLAGIPWAYCIHGRLTKIETSLKDNLHSSHRIVDFDVRLSRLEYRASLGKEDL